LASNEQDGPVQDKLKLTPSVSESLSNGGRESQDGEMCEVVGFNWMASQGINPQTVTPTLDQGKSLGQAVFISSPAASPVKTSPSPGSGPDSKVNAQASSGKSSASRKSSKRRGAFSRTSQGFLVPIMDATCGPSSTGYGNAGLLSAGGFWTASISESPSDAVACSLSAVLQTQVSPRYFLSPRAARGILRRAKKRGRELPPALQAALTVLVSTDPDDGARMT